MNSYVRKTPVVDWLTRLNINSRTVTALASAAVVVVTAIYAYVDSGADLDGRSPSRTCLPVEPSADPHGVPTNGGGVGQDTEVTVMTPIYEFIIYTEPTPCSNTLGDEI